MPVWIETPQKLSLTLQFVDFRSAFSFMTQVALVAEAMNHHPGWSNSWNRVDISLSTHDAGDMVTGKDRDLARAIDTILSGYSHFLRS